MWPYLLLFAIMLTVACVVTYVVVRQKHGARAARRQLAVVLISTAITAAMLGGIAYAVTSSQGRGYFVAFQYLFATALLGFSTYLLVRRGQAGPLLLAIPGPLQQANMHKVALGLFGVGFTVLLLLDLFDGFTVASVGRLLFYGSFMLWNSVLFGLPIELRERGLVASGSVTPWSAIRSYSWSGERRGLLLIHLAKGRVSWGPAMIQVPAAQCDAVEQILDARVRPVGEAVAG